MLLLPCYLWNDNWTWTNVVYLWIQEEPRGEYNNNQGAQTEHWWQVGVSHLNSLVKSEISILCYFGI